MTQSHEELQALAAGFVLGTLDRGERRMFEAHLGKCRDCAADVQSLVRTLDALGRSVPQRTPPAALKQRVMSSIGETTPPPVWQDSARATPPRDRRVWLPVSAMVLIALGAGIYGSHLHVESRLAALSVQAEASAREIAAAQRVASDARTAMEVLAAPDVVRIDLEGQGAAATATARALWSRQRGMVFTGTNLPTPPSGTRYQVWLITARATISAGILPESGNGLAIFDVPRDIPHPLGAAVTVEPLTGADAPTGAQILVGTTPVSF